MNEGGERCPKKRVQWKKMIKLQKRTIAVLETVCRQRAVANKIIQIQIKRIEQVEKVNERLISENLSQSLLLEELRRQQGRPRSLPKTNYKIPKTKKKHDS